MVWLYSLPMVLIAYLDDRMQLLIHIFERRLLIKIGACILSQLFGLLYSFLPLQLHVIAGRHRIYQTMIHVVLPIIHAVVHLRTAYQYLGSPCRSSYRTVQLGVSISEWLALLYCLEVASSSLNAKGPSGKMAVGSTKKPRISS